MSLPGYLMLFVPFFFLVSPFLLVFCQHSTTIRQFTSLLHPLLTLSAKLLALAKFSMVELRA
jgi:hypothetical protein